MKSRPIWEYIFAGTCLRYLNDAGEGWQVHDWGFVDYNLRKALADLERFELLVTHRVMVNRLGNLHAELETAPLDAKLTQAQAKTLREGMEAVRTTLESEAAGKVAWIASDKRYAIEKLLGDMRSLMAPGIYDSMPSVARFDFDEAGKCIAFEMPTAAAFHILRGTEDVLRGFYKNRVKHNRVSPLLWGPIVAGLRKRSRPPSAVLLNDLDSIRVTFRNPTDHPELIYDIDGVQDLLNRCIEVVNRMVKET